MAYSAWIKVKLKRCWDERYQAEEMRRRFPSNCWFLDSHPPQPAFFFLIWSFLLLILLIATLSISIMRCWKDEVNEAVNERWWLRKKQAREAKVARVGQIFFFFFFRQWFFPELGGVSEESQSRPTQQAVS